ncbi:hypothetical protein FR943_00045 [Mycobacterium sp. TNTM28]|uniref:Uncharacterized protein n=1 Tax=[Mycobacterium] fortunisiensis TaxID=2600579 RepID=A0ABS6KFA8_9MYCO|nr:hypothetical protein [[Mycobacterium] fortunisiensis]MBU9762250.1 hypothetical protein [[Mycobacterium] fortunisiensis]
MTTDQRERLLRMAGLMWSNADRAARAWRMGEWALLHQVRADGSSKPRDPSRFVPDRGSSLDLDDSHFLPQLGGNFVSSTARFPVMNAAECLVGASQAFGASLEQRRTSTLSTGILCRSAIESAAKTIWLLADPNRAVRRARTLGYTEREIGYQKKYIAVEKRFLDVRTDRRGAARQSFAETEQQYRARLNFLTSLPQAARQRPPSDYEFFVRWAGNWIDKNPPAHITDADGLPYGMSIGAERFYTVGSSFVHGYKWMTAYLGTEEGVLTQLADSLAAAIIMTECAVALYEAQATHPARARVRRKNYPEQLESTVSLWADRYHLPAPAMGEPIPMLSTHTEPGHETV